MRGAELYGALITAVVSARDGIDRARSTALGYMKPFQNFLTVGNGYGDSFATASSLVALNVISGKCPVYEHEINCYCPALITPKPVLLSLSNCSYDWVIGMVILDSVRWCLVQIDKLMQCISHVYNLEEFYPGRRKVYLTVIHKPYHCADEL